MIFYIIENQASNQVIISKEMIDWGGKVIRIYNNYSLDDLKEIYKGWEVEVI